MYTYTEHTHTQSCKELELYTHNTFSPSNPLVNEWDSCHDSPALWQVSVSVSPAHPSTHMSSLGLHGIKLSRFSTQSLAHSTLPLSLINKHCLGILRLSPFLQHHKGCLPGKDVSWGCAAKAVGVPSVPKPPNSECPELAECRPKTGWLTIGKALGTVDRLNG